MLTVTNTALERLTDKLAHKNAPDDVALRFKREEGCWRLQVDRARPDDATFAHKGRKVLLLDGVASRAMTKMKLDVHQTKAGPRLRLSSITK